jgi:hypothetical protein
VRILEVRFHPRSKSGREAVVVGRVLCEGRAARVEPVSIAPEAVKPFDSLALFCNLQLLVASVVGDPFHELAGLRSGFWSFVEVPDGR